MLLKVRALERCLREFERLGGDRKVPGKSRPVPAAEAAEYFRGATRTGEGSMDWAVRYHAESGRRPSQYLDFCAAAQGWAERKEAVAGDDLPPHRLGAFSELWSEDAQQGQRGQVLTMRQIRDGEAEPPPGALACFHRGRGRGHVERVVMSESSRYLSIGANEGGRPGCWQLEWRGYDDPQLVGFCECDEGDVLEPFGFEWTERLWRGIDVSHFQRPDAFDWQSIGETEHFGIARATYWSTQNGRTMRDRMGRDYFLQFGRLRMRGLYGWFNQFAKGAAGSPDNQLWAFLDVFDEYTDGLEPNDIIMPVVDVEPPPGALLDVGWWADFLDAACDRCVRRYGHLPIVYGNVSDLSKLGPGPWNECPLWLAHYTTKAEPTLPTAPNGVTYWDRWDIWQYRADPFPTVPAGSVPGYGGGRLPIDMNHARSLPMLDGSWR